MKSDSTDIVLLYHRLSDEKPDPCRLAVSPENFLGHVHALCNFVSVVSLDEMFSTPASSREIRVALTFDDGYYDNLWAAQVLKENELPATFFIPTEILTEAAVYWWDFVADLLLRSRLSYDLTHLLLDWFPQLTNSKSYQRLYHHGMLNSWHIGEGTKDIFQLEAYQHLHNLLLNSSPQQRENILQQLRPFRTAARSRKGARYLSRTEVANILNSPLFQLGGHTHSHASLTTLSESDQQTELTRSKLALEQTFHRPVRYFAYPFGQPRDMPEHAPRLLAQTGYTAAFVAHADDTDSESRWVIPRFLVPNAQERPFHFWLRGLTRKSFWDAVCAHYFRYTASR